MPTSVEPPPLIKVTDLDVVFGHGADTVHAVRSAGFSVAEGETFGLVGESGSGKSTVLRALSGLNADWSGTIEIAGVAQDSRRDKAFYKTVQMVFQDPYGSLHPRHTVDSVLSEPCSIHGIQDVERRQHEILAEVGLGPACE